jgi:hypothetical protein
MGLHVFAIVGEQLVFVGKVLGFSTPVVSDASDFRRPLLELSSPIGTCRIRDDDEERPALDYVRVGQRDARLGLTRGSS